MGVDAQPGLDFDFLRYIGVLPENQRRIQGYYLPYFETRRKVIDLGCGDADFVALLAERGVDVVGVDSDDKACEAAWSRGLPVVKRDLFDYLRDLRANSVDGIFSAHLVEHLPFPNALELVRQSWRVLKPGGVIVLATPNARSLFSHLEMFYLHFGHVSFYHPRLLCFFLEHEGFTRVSHGENPETASPLLAEARQIRDNLADVNLGLDAQESPTGFLPPPAAAPVDNSADMGRWLTALRSGRVAQVAHLSAIGAPPRGQVAYRREIPVQGRTLLHELSYRIKRRLTRWLVQPLTDDLVEQLNSALSTRDQQEDELFGRLTELVRQADSQLAEMVTSGDDQLAAALVQEHQQWAATMMRGDQQLADSIVATGTSLFNSLVILRDALQREAERRRAQAAALERESQLLRGDVRSLAGSLQSLNGAFECYALGYKPSEDIE